MALYSDSANRYKVMRELAGVRIQDAARLLRVSYSFLWNAENDFGKLTDQQVETLEALYLPKVNDRLKIISQVLHAGK
jgi:hypothetical protein